LRFVPNIIIQFFTKDDNVVQLQNILGFKPSNLALYELALQHRSINTESGVDNNERLEYLGDAILGAVISDQLYKKYPMQNEGFLTEMRSKIVNRASLNTIAQKIGLRQLTKFNKNDPFLRNSQIFGNALEALIGAVYIDKGFIKTKKFVQDRILSIHLDLDVLENEESNLKNKIIGWANRNKKSCDFVLLEEVIDGRKKIFTIGVQIGNEIIAKAKAVNKKEASKLAAKNALTALNIVEL
jgi:ribonuclease III